MSCFYTHLIIGYLVLFTGFAAVVPEDAEDEDYDYTELNSTTNGSLQFTKELFNITKDPGKSVRLVCEVKNLDNSTHPKVTFKWLKFSVPVVPDKRITIKRFDKPDQKLFKSVLKISNLETMDKAFYECVANNGIDKIKSQGLLTVSGERWGSPSSDIPFYNPNLGHTDSMNNIADITTFIPNTNQRARDELLSTITNPVLPKIHEQTASNPILFDKPLEPVFKYNSSEKFCQMYKGNRCRDFLEGKYVFVQPPYSQDEIELKIEKAFGVISQSQDISSSCNKFAYPSLCYSAFPLCVYPQQSNVHQEYLNKNGFFDKNEKGLKEVKDNLALLRICKDDCKLLETELCSKEYAIAKRHPVIGQILELEECEYLPDDTFGSARNCLRLGIDHAQNVDEDDNCYWDDGRSYRGVVDRSISGKKCLKWSHQFHILISEYPELVAHSYCRNPGGQEPQPFCYIEQTKREACAITKCAHVVVMYIGAFLLGLIVVVCAIIIFICVRRRNRSTKNLQNMSVPTADKNIYGNPGPNSPMELSTLLPPNIPPQRNHHSNKNGFQNVRQYTHKELTFVEELGEGAFGKVYKGELKTKNGKVFVAVKSLKEDANAKTQADFQREIELISELKHQNIICLLGVVTKQEPMCMLFEFMSEGDLHEFLIANSPNEGKSLSQLQFLHIAIQIAQGMEYLSDNHYVHRDLAARNCLVTKDLVVKISDFGLSRDMYSCDYYRVQSKSLLPVRWMPPESILYGKFTTESDVWSYGVVLWEIYSYGLQPYYGYNNQEVINMIRARKLLPCPEACPSYCYSLMVECWAELAVRRPSFGEISHRLRVWKQNGNTAGAYFKTPEVYTNPQQKFGHSSKSDTHAICPTMDANNDPWEHNLKKSSSRKLNESQSSLTSRSSSLGNKTQSTSLSNEHRGSNRKSGERRSHRVAKNEDSLDRKNVVVSANGESIESKLTQ